MINYYDKQPEGAALAAAYLAAPQQLMLAALVTEYRCKAKFCLLWHAWAAPALGVCFYLPSHQVSPERYEEYRSLAGWPAELQSAERRIGGVGGQLELLDWSGVQLGCDHLTRSVPKFRLEGDVSPRPGSPVGRMFLR